MPRRRARSPLQQPFRLPLHQRVETGPDGYEYVVAPIAGARAVKIYRCPGCDHEIRCGVAHVVVWQADVGGAAFGEDARPGSPHSRGGDAGEDRRHWHTPCWTNRHNRRPTRKWS
ncbi:hypothetical protein [Mycolicibacter minnesotensis]